MISFKLEISLCIVSFLFDTKKITDQLKLRRKKKEKGIKIKKGDPNFSDVRIAGLTPEADTRRKSGMGSMSSPYNTKSIY